VPGVSIEGWRGRALTPGVDTVGVNQSPKIDKIDDMIDRLLN